MARRSPSPPRWTPASPCRIGALGPDEPAVDLDRWLELTGSDDIESTAAAVDGARRLQGKLLDVLDDPGGSVVPSPTTDLDQEGWENLDPAERIGARRAALRRIDPRLVPRTVRRVSGGAPPSDP
jgi:hypothetical protein